MADLKPFVRFFKTKAILNTMNLIKTYLILGGCLICLSSFIFPSDFLIEKEQMPGYIILENDEKIDGSIIPGSVTDNEVKVKFVENGKKKTYKPKKVKAYGYQIFGKNDVGKTVSEWIHYERLKVDLPPKPFGPTTVFMRKEVEGAIQLYSYYVEMRAKRENPFQHSYFIRKSGGKIKEITEKKFRRMSLELFRDYRAMHQRIGQKQFQHKNLIRMVRDYNFWVQNGHDAYEYKVSPENYDLN